MNVHTKATSTAIMNLHAHAAMIANTSARWMFDMASKALEAAVAAFKQAQRKGPYEETWVETAIRAFGQNLSEESVQLIGIGYCRVCDRHMTEDLFGVEAVRAAIEKDLE